MKWISVKDRLPEIGYYLVYCYIGGVREITGAVFYHSLQAWIIICPCIDVQDNYEEEITHWMPLPEPPEAKNEVD